MYTREALARRIADGTAVYKTRSRIMAAFAVLGGIGQLWMHRLIEARYDRATSQPIELAMFIVYMIVVVAMIVWMNRGVAALTPRCEACGAQLTGMSGRVAMAAGKCDQCGAQVIE
jgi:uncharacterized membrane protein